MDDSETVQSTYMSAKKIVANEKKSRNSRYVFTIPELYELGKSVNE